MINIGRKKQPCARAIALFFSFQAKNALRSTLTSVQGYLNDERNLRKTKPDFRKRCENTLSIRQKQGCKLPFVFVPFSGKTLTRVRKRRSYFCLSVDGFPEVFCDFRYVDYVDNVVAVGVTLRVMRAVAAWGVMPVLTV